METEQLTSVGGLMQESLLSPMHGFDALGSNSIDSLPTPDPARYPLLTFTAPASGTKTVSWTRSGSGNVDWGDGTVDSGTSHTYTGLTAGDQITISLVDRYTGTFVAGSDIKDLENLTFWWDALRDSQYSINLKDMGITRRMTPDMDSVYSNINFTGNSIEGKFARVTASGSLFIANNNFVGDLPIPRLSSITNYVIKENGFRGAIHDISSCPNIKRYSAYGQDDGVVANTQNPRIMLTGEIPDLSSTPIEYYHVGNGGQANYLKGLANDLTVASDFDVPTTIEEFYAGTCGLSQAEVDLILSKFAAKVGTFTNPNKISIGGGNSNASATGNADATTLRNNGWTVILAPDF
jgi:hypothetical protein